MRKRLLQILIILLCAFCIVFYARYIKGSSRVEIIEMQVTCPDYIVRVMETPMNENSMVTFPILNVVELEDEELLNRIQNNIIASSIGWMPEYLEELEFEGNKVNYSSNKYLSVSISYCGHTKPFYHFIAYTTIDMETGDIVYLDDLLEIDEELVERILKEGTTEKELIGIWHGNDYIIEQEHLNKYTEEQIIERLHECCEGYSEGKWYTKTSFYIKHNRLYLRNIFYEASEVYITLDKIEDKLKVEKW